MWFFDKIKNTLHDLRYLRAERDMYQNAFDEVSDDINRDRRTTGIEYKDEVELLTQQNRLQIIANVRESIRSFSLIKGWEDQFRRNVIGKGQSLSIKSNDTTLANEAANWFNNWAKSPDAFDPRKTFGRLSQLQYSSYRRDGDILIYFDALGLVNPGKTISFEADQLTEVNKQDFELNKTHIKNQLNPFDANSLDGQEWSERTGIIHQNAGVIFSAKRVIIGYVVCSGNQRAKSSGSYKVSKANEPLSSNTAFILPGVHTYLIFRSDRVNSYRGVSSYLSAINSIMDVKEIISYYKKRMKTQASMSLVYKTKGGTTLRNRNKAQGNDSVDVTTAKTTPQRELKNFLRLHKGAIEEIGESDSIEALQMAADHQTLQEVLKFIMQIEAWGQGLGRLYARGVGESSYTAARSEANLTEVTFNDEKDLMSEFYDWLASQALAWRESQGLGKAPEDMEFTWLNWPKLPQIDPVKDTLAVTNKMKAGLTNLKKQKGPKWLEFVEQLGEEKEAASKQGLVLSQFEKAVELDTPENDNDKDSDNE